MDGTGDVVGDGVSKDSGGETIDATPIDTGTDAIDCSTLPSCDPSKGSYCSDGRRCCAPLAGIKGCGSCTTGSFCPG